MFCLVSDKTAAALFFSKFLEVPPVINTYKSLDWRHGYLQHLVH